MKLIVADVVANYYKINTRTSAKVNGKRQPESMGSTRLGDTL